MTPLRSTIAAIVLGVGSVPLAVTFARAQELVPIQVPNCEDVPGGEAAAKSEWEFACGSQLGVQARAGGGGDFVGLNPATDGFHDWAPFDAYKTTICGELSRFGTFEPDRANPLLRFLPELPEHDWNIIMVPTPGTVFQDKFKLATQFMERGHERDLLRCSDIPCFEAEVTPQRRLQMANAAIPLLSGSQRGQTICVFGPWVGDGGHGYRPEIHPAERIWWRDGPSLKLLFVQDSSERFGDHRQYKWGREPHPKFWRPWAAPGLEGEFRVAFKLPPAPAAPLDFKVDQVLDRSTRKVSPPAPSAQPTFALQQGGSTVGTVKVTLGVGESNRRLAVDLSRLGVRLVDVCRRNDGTVQGYLSLRDKVGFRHQQGEGFDAFEVAAPPGATECSDVPKSPKTPAEPTKTGTVLQILAREVLEETVEAPSRDLWRSLLQAADSHLEPPATDHRLRIGKTRLFSLRAIPHYDGPREERINEAAEKGHRKDYERLLHAIQARIPAEIEWHPTVRDLSSGTELTRIDGRLSPSGVPAGHFNLNCRDGLLKRDRCELAVPAELEGVLRVNCRAWVVYADPPPPQPGAPAVARGVEESPAGVDLSTHFIRARNTVDADRVMSWLAELIHSPELATWATDERTVERDAPADDEKYRRAYRARTLRHGLVLATTDGKITRDELAQFVAMATEFVQPPGIKGPDQIQSVK